MKIEVKQLLYWCLFSCVNSSYPTTIGIIIYYYDYSVIIIKYRLHAKAGETVLIHGASGGVSTYVIIIYYYSTIFFER